MKSIVDVAILIPIHPPKYVFMYTLLKKLIEHHITIDIHLIFSNEKDYHDFHMKSNIHPIIVKGPINEASIVTSKKFYGLKQLINSKYEYIITCDSEIDIIPENFTNENILSKLNAIFKNKKIYGGDAVGELSQAITRISSNIFPNDYEKLRSITDNFRIYFWWSDIPVYRRSDINDFLSHVNCDILVWEHFDYIMYQYYLMIKHEFTLVNYTPIIKRKWSMEELYTTDEHILNKLIELGYGFSWVTGKLFNLNPSTFTTRGTFMKYHMDCTHHGLRYDTLL